MKKPIIIQGALQSEIDILLSRIKVENKIFIGDYVFYECIYKNYPVVISKTKMGEITSAIATTLAIQKYDPLFILNQGTAGALVEWLNKGDIVIGNKMYYMSQYSTDKNKDDDPVNPWKKDGYKTIDNECISYDANENILKLIQNLEVIKKPNVYFDIVGSGDVWTKDFDQMKDNNKEFEVVCETMECAGAYLAANSLNVPLITIRVISNNELKNQEYDETSGIISQEFVISIVDELLEYAIDHLK